MSQNQTDREFDNLLDYLKNNRGFDFTGYKRSSLMRRVCRRMQAVTIEGFAHYQGFLEAHPEEFSQLFNTILINVTGFFRDPDAWDYVAEETIPGILAAKEPGEPIRVWSAGTASGEEAYTLAMVLVERLGPEEFARRAKIFATDVDEDALAHARRATYPQRAVEGVPPALLTSYFEHVHLSYVFNKDLRRSIIFGRHDLVQDAPISRIDLLVCRNTLMYFNAETQGRILTHFHFALNEKGSLFLGKAEMLLTHADLFTPVDVKQRVFRPVTRPNGREGMLSRPQPPADKVG